MISEAHTVTPRGRVMSKVDQYHWKIRNEPGVFAMIDKRLIQVDHEYQRDRVSNARVLDIASNWDWVGFGTISVAQRSDGTYWAVDGQHRKLAADKRADINKLPCMVFAMHDTSDEAVGFLMANTLRGPVQTIDKFNAMVKSRDEAALRVKAALDASGLKLATDGNNIKAVACAGCLLSLFSDILAAADLWPLILDMSIARGQRINSVVVESLMELRRKLSKSKDGQKLTDKHNYDKLVELGMDGCARAIAKAKGYFGKGGARIGAQGITDAVNHRRTSRKLPQVIEG